MNTIQFRSSPGSNISSKASPADNASILSKLYFEWTTSLVLLGGKRSLDHEDLWDLPKGDDTAAIGASFNANWDVELKRFQEEIEK